MAASAVAGQSVLRHSEATAFRSPPCFLASSLRDRQADARARHTIRQLVAEPVERLEYLSFLALGNAGPCR